MEQRSAQENCGRASQDLVSRADVDRVAGKEIGKAEAGEESGKAVEGLTQNRMELAFAQYFIQQMQNPCSF